MLWNESTINLSRSLVLMLVIMITTIAMTVITVTRFGPINVEQTHTHICNIQERRNARISKAKTN